MSKCRICKNEFTPCADKYANGVGFYGTYACSEICGTEYVRRIKESRSQSNSKSESEIHQEALNEAQIDGIFELQKSRLEEYKKQDETIIQTEIIEETPKVSYIKRRKTIDKTE